MWNVNSLLNKFNELSALSNQSIYREHRLIIFTEIWLTQLVLDANMDLLGFTTVQADRDTKACSKSKGGGLVIYVNSRWCHPGHISVGKSYGVWTWSC